MVYMDYTKISLVLNNVSKTENQESGELSKPCVKMLLACICSIRSGRETLPSNHQVCHKKKLAENFESMFSRATKVEGIF